LLIEDHSLSVAPNSTEVKSLVSHCHSRTSDT
jgi:hypothetical protein